MLSVGMQQWWQAQTNRPIALAAYCDQTAQRLVMILLVLSLAFVLFHWVWLMTVVALACCLRLQKLTSHHLQQQLLQNAQWQSALHTSEQQAVADHESVVAETQLLATLITQLGFGQKLGDQSVNQLVEDFNLLYVSLGQSMQLAQSAAQRFEPGQDSFAATSEMSLAQVLQMLQQALQRKSLLLESNQQVAQAAGALKNQTEIIQRISKEITLLSLNASIEAARAGEAGRGFSVVAERVRELSDTTSQAANDIISRMQTLMQAIDGSSSQLQCSGEMDEQLMADANRQIGTVLSGFSLMTRELCGTIGQLEQTQLQVQHKLEDAVRNFQFQDRVSQRLTHVISAMQQLQNLRADSAVIQRDDLEQLGINLYQSYTMQDERELHQAAVPGERSEHSQQDITFF